MTDCEREAIRTMTNTLEIQTIHPMIDDDWTSDEDEETTLNALTDEDYQQGRLMAALLLWLDDVQRTNSLDVSRLQDLAVATTLGG